MAEERFGFGLLLAHAKAAEEVERLTNMVKRSLMLTLVGVELSKAMVDPCDHISTAALMSQSERLLTRHSERASANSNP